MAHKLILGGYRDSIAVASFDPLQQTLKVLKENKAPKATAWIEPSTGDSNTFYSLSEEDGVAFGITLDGDKVTTTQQRPTNGGPAHSE